MKVEHNLAVLDKDGNEGPLEVPAYVSCFNDVILVEIDGVSVYIEKQMDIVGVYVGTGDDGRSDAILSLRLERFEGGQNNLRYDRRRCVVQSTQGA